MHGSPIEVWRSLGFVAQGVIVTLVVMSIVSLGLIAERYWTYREATRQSRRFAPEAARLLRQGQLGAALEAATRGPFARAYLAGVVAAGLQEWTFRQRDEPALGDAELAAAATRAALEHASNQSLAELRRGLHVLATIGSTAPFVGLFGTTFGIINAFGGMAITGSSNISAVSAGISEALVTTAFGLFVAVPAIWAYNFFLGRADAIGVELERSRFQLLEHLVKSTA